MEFFRLFTPISYWLLTILWLFIFIFYVNRIRTRRLKSKLFVTLLIILAIDSFRTLFESIYFGAWYTSLVGFIPKSIHNFLVRPENVFIPKALNVIAAVLVIVIVLRRWIPEEEDERERESKNLNRLEKEIHERKQTQYLLQESEKRLNEAQKLAKVGHYVLDVKSGNWTSSLELDEIFGIEKKDKRIVEDWIQILHPDHRKELTVYLQEHVLGKGNRFDREYKIVNLEDKKTYWVHGIGELKFDTNGNVIEMLGTIQDITERKLMEDDLKTSKDKLHSLVQKIKAAVIVHGKDTEIKICNKVALNLLGLTEDQVFGKKAIDPLWNFFSEDGKVLPFEKYPVNQVLNSKTELKNMIVNLHRPETNDTINVLVNATPEFDQEGDIYEIIVTFIDITERIQFEKEREKLFNSLQDAYDEIKVLQGIVPICANCKKIRDDQGYWNVLESYIETHSEASFSHSMCPECSDKLYGDEDWYIKMKKKKGSNQ